MKILLDNNLSFRLSTLLAKQLPVMAHVTDFGLDRADDLTIWDFAWKDKWHIMTKDQDFHALQQLKGFPPKIIWLRCGNLSTNHLAELLITASKDIQEFLTQEAPGLLEILPKES
ncbi:MAG: DUF5615 family PIN-like protein [Bacteroidota bacterium]